jgi:hypothetical protein
MRVTQMVCRRWITLSKRRRVEEQVLPAVIAPVRRTNQVSSTVGRTLSPHLHGRIRCPKRLACRPSCLPSLILSPSQSAFSPIRCGSKKGRTDLTSPALLPVHRNYAGQVSLSVSHAHATPFALASCQPPASDVRRTSSAPSCLFRLSVRPCGAASLSKV